MGRSGEKMQAHACVESRGAAHLLRSGTCPGWALLISGGAPRCRPRHVGEDDLAVAYHRQRLAPTIDSTTHPASNSRRGRVGRSVRPSGWLRAPTRIRANHTELGARLTNTLFYKTVLRLFQPDGTCSRPPNTSTPFPDEHDNCSCEDGPEPGDFGRPYVANSFAEMILGA